MQSKTVEVTDLNNKAALASEAASNREKLKGEFSLKLNSKLRMPKKIEKFANDAAAFYLHKNRNFLQKLEEQAKERLA
jgi:hypothetical protein